MRKKPSLTQKILHKARHVKRGSDGVTTIVRDSYHGHSKTWWEISEAVRVRDDNRCRYVTDKTLPSGGVVKSRCLRSVANGHRIEVHHITPLSAGGKSISSNLICLCETHHTGKHHHLKRKS